ncbi:MAG: hypothetical protein WC446_06345 [Candidatus Paceibacterota bacterium]|jgi:hypothetical protein|nr:hypothetical protein [Bacteroidales bacterium]
MKLGNISEELKKLAIQTGSVFKMIINPYEGVIPKEESDKSRTKYFVVIGIDEESIQVGSLLINSEVNINMCHMIAQYQFCIYPENYQFLGDKYRYVDCYRIKELQFKRIISDGHYIDRIKPEDFKKVIQYVNNSPVNKPSTLKKYGIFIEKSSAPLML